MVKLIRKKSEKMIKHTKESKACFQENNGSNINVNSKEEFVQKSELIFSANQMFHKYDSVFKRLSE